MFVAAVLCTIKATEIIDDYCKDCEFSVIFDRYLKLEKFHGSPEINFS